jgi:hypothetical protein
MLDALMWQHHIMRTTLDIADDVLNAAKERARRENKSAGQVISELARAALTNAPEHATAEESRHAFRPFASRGGIVTNDLIDKLRGEDFY